MAGHSIDEFVQATAQNEAAGALFELENPYLLEVNLRGRVWTKVGAMIAYTGAVEFTIRLSGTGMVAITTHFEPLTLRVVPGQAVFTDPNATVAWSGSLTPEIVTAVSFRTLIGRGSGEAIQLRFAGDGWVVLQPYEEVYAQATGGQ